MSGRLSRKRQQSDIHPDLANSRSSNDSRMARSRVIVDHSTQEQENGDLERNDELLIDDGFVDPRVFKYDNDSTFSTDPSLAELSPKDTALWDKLSDDNKKRCLQAAVRVFLMKGITVILSYTEMILTYSFRRDK